MQSHKQLIKINTAIKLHLQWAISRFILGRLHHSVSLHHATLGEAAVVFIFLSTPREGAAAATASA